MIRFKTCIAAACVFYTVTFGLTCLAGYLFDRNWLPVLPALGIGYFLGLNRMRLLANQGREDEERKQSTVASFPRGNYQRGRWNA